MPHYYRTARKLHSIWSKLAKRNAHPTSTATFLLIGATSNRVWWYVLKCGMSRYAWVKILHSSTIGPITLCTLLGGTITMPLRIAIYFFKGESTLVLFQSVELHFSFEFKCNWCCKLSLMMIIEKYWEGHNYLLRLTSLRILQLVLRTKKVMMYYIPLLEKMTSVVAISNVVL